MGKNTFANVVSGAGGVYYAQKGSLACKAFASAAKNFCRDKPIRKRSASAAQKATYARRGKFNDYFYRSLAARDKSLARSIVRERADVFQRVGSGASAYSRCLGSAAGLATGGRGPKAARAMGAVANNAFNKARRAGRHVDGARGAAARLARRRVPNRSYYLRFQDGTLGDGSNIELKGPGDKQRDGQFLDGKKASDNGTLIVVSCESCGEDWCKNGCP